MKLLVFVDFRSGFLGSLRSVEMTEVMMNTPAMEEIGLSPRKDGLSYQVSSQLVCFGCLGAWRLLLGLETQVCIPTASWKSSVILGKSPGAAEPQFLHLQSGNKKQKFPQGLT